MNSYMRMYVQLLELGPLSYAALLVADPNSLRILQMINVAEVDKTVFCTWNFEISPCGPHDSLVPLCFRCCG